MNYIFGSFLRELEYQNVTLKQPDLDRVESITDILTEFEAHGGDITNIDYNVGGRTCTIAVTCLELVIRYPEDRALYDAIELADRFEFKQVAGSEDNLIQLTLTINI